MDFVKVDSGGADWRGRREGVSDIVKEVIAYKEGFELGTPLGKGGGS